MDSVIEIITEDDSTFEVHSVIEEQEIDADEDSVEADYILEAEDLDTDEDHGVGAFIAVEEEVKEEVNTVEEPPTVTEEDTSVTTITNLTCDACGRRMRTIQGFNQHLLQKDFYQTCRKGYSCNKWDCPLKFDSSDEAILHRKSHGRQLLPRECDVCGISVTSYPKHILSQKHLINAATAEGIKLEEGEPARKRTKKH